MTANPVYQNAPLLLSATAVAEASAIVRKLSTIEKSRIENGISKRHLARSADVAWRWYLVVLQEPHRATSDFVARLQAGLRRLLGEAANGDRTPLILSTYGGFLAAICPFYRVTPTQVRATHPQHGATADRHWQACAHARQAAIYLTNTALGVSQRHLAQALRLTPAAVCLAMQSVEDRRSDPKFDAALSAAQRDVTGECDG